MAAAAGVWLGNRGRGLVVVDLDDDQSSDADRVQAIVHAAGRKPTPRRSDDRGEAECIALGRSNGSVVATNDATATNVARVEGLATTTVVDLLRRDVDSGLRTAVESNKLVAKMRKAGLDLGENISGPLDLTRRQRTRSTPVE